MLYYSMQNIVRDSVPAAPKASTQPDSTQKVTCHILSIKRYGVLATAQPEKTAIPHAGLTPRAGVTRSRYVSVKGALCKFTLTYVPGRVCSKFVCRLQRDTDPKSLVLMPGAWYEAFFFVW